MSSQTMSQNSSIVGNDEMELTLSSRGEITSIGKKDGSWTKNLKGLTVMGNCTQMQEVQITTTQNNGVQCTKKYTSEDGVCRCTVVDRFIPESTSIRWEVEVEGSDHPWSTGIGTMMTFSDSANARFWTTWGNPDHLSPADWGDNPDVWHNPFEYRTFRNMHLVYGGHFGKGAGYAIPVFSVMYPEEMTGISLAMSPEDPLLDVQMVTTREGEVKQTRKFNRLEKGKPVTFTMHLCIHAPDWRSVISFVIGKYPRYFVPPAKNALEICGLGAYSSYEGEMDVEKYKKMGGIVNWKASFDFSYMGMFVPPVETDTTKWKRFSVDSRGELLLDHNTYTSIEQMRNYARRMKELGFSTLNYFNLTEFGGVSEFASAVVYPRPQFTDAGNSWTNPSAYLYKNFPGAILFGALDHVGWHSRTPEQQMNSPVQFHDQPFWTWGGAIATDVGDPAYARFLLNQAQIHVDKFPDAQGICIDRFDWFNDYNWHADDGQTWIEGRPVRSLLNSYKSFMPRLSAIMHDGGKVIFCNPHMNRLELMEFIDGVYNEFGHMGHNLNLSAFLTFYKPLICWTPDKATVMKSPDRYLQTHLLMGAFPTAPFPGNDHTLGPDPEVERYYLDYGPMFTHLRGRTWVMIPEVIEVRNGTALSNLFTVGKRIVVPIVMGREDSAAIRIRHCDQLLLPSVVSVETWYPGESKPAKSELKIHDNELAIKMPLQRGCAFLVISP